MRGDLSKSVTASQRTRFLLQATVIIGCLVWFGGMVGVFYSRNWYIIKIMSGNEFSILKIDKSLWVEIKLPYTCTLINRYEWKINVHILVECKYVVSFKLWGSAVCACKYSP